MTEAEEAAFRLGDPSHRREFIENAALTIYVAAMRSGHHDTAGKGQGQAPPVEWAARLAADLWEQVEKKLSALEARKP